MRSSQTAGEGLARRHAAQWRQRAAGHGRDGFDDGNGARPFLASSLSHGQLIAEHAQTEGRKRLEQRHQREKAIRRAQRCLCWNWIVVKPMQLLVACGVGLWRRWLLPPLAWLCTLMLRVLSMIMDAFSMLFMALEEDLRFREQNANHGERHISHALAQLHERHFHGKSVALPDHEQLWIVLFYSPRSKVGGDRKLQALRMELQELSLAKLIERAEQAHVDTAQLAGAQEFVDTHSFICPWRRETEEGEAARRTQQTEQYLRTEVISFIIRATYRRSGVEAVQRFNDAARHLETAVGKNPEAGQTRMPWPACPPYQGRAVRLGVVNIDDMMSNNDELAINMGVSSLDPRFMLLDGCEKRLF